MSMAAVAIGTTAVAVGGAAVSAGMQMSAADKAAKAQGAAGKKLRKQTKKATQAYEEKMDKATQDFVRNQNELAKQVGDIPLPQYDLEQTTLRSINAANLVTENAIEQAKKLTGRDPREMFDMLAKWEGRLGDQYIQVQRGMPLIDQQQAVVSKMIEGQLPEVTQQQISRALAERGGAGFSMQTSGRTPFIQRPQAMLAENIRQSSEERMRAGLALAPGVIEQRRGVAATTLGLSEGARGIFGSWMDAALSFINPENVPRMMQLEAQGQEPYVRNRLAQYGAMSDIGSSVYNALGTYASNIYNAQTGQAQQGYQISQANTQANLARDQAGAAAVGDITKTAASAAMSGAGAYNQYATAKASGIPQYSSLASAQQAAPYAGGYSQIQGMGYVQRATAV